MAMTSPEALCALRDRSLSTSLPHPSLRFIALRRVPISLLLFSVILGAEGIFELGWHRVDARSDFVFGVAIAILLLGLGIRSWAAGTINKSSVLATSGAYSLCRHPLYLGTFLIISGVCLGTHPFINFPIVAPLATGMYLCAIRSEEVMLSQLFGSEWTRYTAATPRLIPNPLSCNVKLTAWSIERWRSNREYQAVLASVPGIAGMFYWYAYR